MKNHLIDEIWKDIKGYEGLYQASTLGEIRRKESIVIDKDKKGIRKQLTINKAIRYLENVLDNQHLFKREELLDILIKVSYILKER